MVYWPMRVQSSLLTIHVNKPLNDQDFSHVRANHSESIMSIIRSQIETQRRIFLMISLIYTRTFGLRWSEDVRDYFTFILQTSKIITTL